MTSRHAILALRSCLLGLGVLATAAAQAQSTVGAHIGAAALERATGNAAVNIVAGDANAQANLAAMSPDGAAALASVQRVGVAVPLPDARSHIGAGAFASARGLFATNLAAGNGNAQLNAAAFGPAAAASIEAVSDGLLASASANTSRTDSASRASDLREAVVHPDAYRNASGLVQLNQTAGSGNVSSNVFVLRPPAGTFFQ